MNTITELRLQAAKGEVAAWLEQALAADARYCLLFPFKAKRGGQPVVCVGGRTVAAAQGENNANARFTEAEITEIRALEGLVSARALGRSVGTRHKTITDIWNRRTWRHL